MKYLFALVIASIILGTCSSPAQSTAPATSPEGPQPGTVAGEVKAIVQNIRAKLKDAKGKLTAADLAPEIAAFDALLSKHPGEKTDEMAQAAYMKATLYLQVLNDTQTGETLLNQVKSDYKDTKFVEGLSKQEAARAEAKKLQAALAPGLPFPDFNETDLAGKPLSIGALKGKVVLVDFWATWCGPCVNELPNVLAAYQKYHGDGFEIVGVSLDSDRAKLDAFLKSHDGMTWAQYFDGQGWKNKIAAKFGIQSIPFTVLVGRDGKIIGTGLRGERLGPAVAEALASK